MSNIKYYGSMNHPHDCHYHFATKACDSHEEAEKEMLEQGALKFITVSAEPTKEAFRRWEIDSWTESMIEELDESLSVKYGFDDVCLELEPDKNKELSEIVKAFLLEHAHFSFSVCDEVKEYDYREPDDGREPL